MSVDWSEASNHCWRCGCERDLERCHIIPDSLGGLDEPSNIVLLCKRCHAEGPNVSDSDIMWDWIKAYKVPLYDTFWFVRGMMEYKFIYKSNFISDVKSILDLAGISIDDADSVIKKTIEDIKTGCSTHFGQPYLNTATIAGLLRITLKKLASEYHVDILQIKNRFEKETPWYMDLIQ